MNKWAEKQKETVEKTKKKVAFKLLESVVMKTPVDSGRARGNWQVSIGSDNTNTTERCSKQGENITEESAKIDTAKGDDTIYITNNLPYIATLEYGGYPDPVKKGSYDKKKKAYVIKSRGGFSKQAPNGMVGVTIANLEKYINEVIKEIK